MPFDAIIVGSGFGGAVAALRLAEAGMRVLVLERGRRWTRNTLPRAPDDSWVWDHANPEQRNGWLDLRIFPHMAVAQGAAVGGGSHIYANISTEAPPESFARGWPPEITHTELKPFYDTVGDVMEVAQVPAKQWTKRMQLVHDAASVSGYGARFRQLDLAVRFDPNWTYADYTKGEAATIWGTNKHGATQGTCVHLGTCDVGCRVSARNTLDLNYLYVAENRHGVDIRPLHLVDRIEPEGTGWRVTYDRLDSGGRIPGSETATILILSAGSLGSTELLLRNRDIHKTLTGLSPTLGQNWSSNGDFLTPALYTDREVDADIGPTIAAIIDFQDGSIGGHQFWIQDGGVPGLVGAYLQRKADAPDTGMRARLVLESLQKLLSRADPLRGLMPWFAQGVDAGNGRLSLTSPGPFTQGGALHLDWDVRQSVPLIETIIDMHRSLAAKTGGEAIVPPTWSLFRDLITPHPLGGCNMGRDPTTGVVDHRGAVFGQRNLFVLDGAVIPRALGVNPSRTIAALAERNARLIARGDVSATSMKSSNMPSANPSDLIETFRDPITSIFQSAAAAADARFRGVADPSVAAPTPVDHAAPIVQAAARAGLAAGDGSPEQASAAQSLTGTFDVCARAYLALAKAEASGDQAAIRGATQQLPQFGVCDPRWKETLTEFLLHYTLVKHGDVPYRRWNKLDDFVLPMPDKRQHCDYW